MMLGAAGSGCFTWAVVSFHGPFQGLSAFAAVRVAGPHPDLVLGVVFEVVQRMRGCSRMGVAVFLRVGRVLVSAPWPSSRGSPSVRRVALQAGQPAEHEPASFVVGGGKNFDGARFRC